MRRILTLTTLILTFTLFAAACGDDPDDVTAGAPGDDTSELPVNDEPDVSTDDEPTLEEPTDGDAADEPAQDLPLGGGPYPIADLSITVDDGEGTVAEYRLACLGDTATFTGDTGLDAAAACLALQELEVRTLLVDGPFTQRACTEIYGGPQTATISGTLDDTAIDTAIDRANGCGISDWDILVGLVGPV